MFIELTELDGKLITLNQSHIITVEEDGKGTFINTLGTIVRVREPYGKVLLIMDSSCENFRAVKRLSRMDYLDRGDFTKEW
jgi:uncharacterized protein YlzI (FlbEa/FlbD family)